MADVDLSDLRGDEFVFHFGGRPKEVDAYTFANSLIAFSEAKSRRTFRFSSRPSSSW